MPNIKEFLKRWYEVACVIILVVACLAAFVALPIFVFKLLGTIPFVVVAFLEFTLAVTILDWYI